MGVLCVQRTLARGWRSGVATGLGIATADTVYAGLAAFGVATVSRPLVTWQDPLQLVGGVALVGMGLVTVLRRPAKKSEETQADGQELNHGSQYISAVGLTLTNPMTIMAFAAVFASAGLAAEPGVGAAALSTLGVGAGSLTWWLLLTGGVSLGRHGLSDTAVTLVTRGSGVVVVVFGVVAVLTSL